MKYSRTRHNTIYDQSSTALVDKLLILEKKEQIVNDVSINNHYGVWKGVPIVMDNHRVFSLY